MPGRRTEGAGHPQPGIAGNSLIIRYRCHSQQRVQLADTIPQWRRPIRIDPATRQRLPQVYLSRRGLALPLSPYFF
jgi:hypothetical protein